MKSGIKNEESGIRIGAGDGQGFEGDSGEDRGMNGGAPDGWAEVKFENFITLQRGKDLTRAQFREGAVPVAGSNGVIGYHDTAIAKAPGITVGRSGSAGKVTVYNEDFWPHNTSLYVREFHGNDPYFAGYLLQSLNLSRFKTGASVPTLDRNSFKTLPILVPPLPEQKKIAHILSTVQRAIEAQERIIQTTTELKKALMHKLFTEGLRNEPQKQTEIGPIPESWEVVELEMIFECFDERRKPVKKSNRLPGPYPYYGASGIVDYVEDYLFEGEYLLLAEDGENLDSRKLPIAFIATGQFWVNNHAHILKTRHGNMQFYEQYIANMPIKDYLSGTTRPKLTKGHMMKIQLPFPPIDQQEEAAVALGNCDAKTNSAKQKQAVLQDLFRTLLHELMTAKTHVAELDATKAAPKRADFAH